MNTYELETETRANAQEMAKEIDRKVANGIPVEEVLSSYGHGQRFWIEVARPFSKALAGK